MKMFFDTEFTELTQKAKLLSLALVAESGASFYAEFSDYDVSKANDWVKENVLSKFFLRNTDLSNTQKVQVLGTEVEIVAALQNWMRDITGNRNKNFQFWGDCPAWDWVLFCELFGGSFGRPANVHYMCMDLATVFQIKGYDPDYERKAFLEEHGITVQGHQHNALYDAFVTKECYGILMQK